MSKIVKSSFVSFTEKKKEIKIIENNDPKVLKSSVKAVEKTSEQESEQGLNKTKDVMHISDEYIQELEEMKQKAEEEAYDKGLESGREQGYQDGYQLGYDEGKTTSQMEAKQALENERELLHQEIEQLRNELKEEFELQKSALEPKMLYIIEGLVKKLIGIQSVSQGTIMFLIKSGMNALDLHGDLVIKVSSFDIDEVLSHKQQLTEGLSEKIDVEVLVDQQLEKNECIIETNMGSIDCSLGTQMESLMQELRLIRDSLEGE